MYKNMKKSEESYRPLNVNYYVQWLATFGVFMLTMQIGIYIGWGSPNVARLMSKSSSIYLTPTEISWMVSLVTIGGLIGAIVGSFSIEFIGSKRTVFLTFSLLSISWLCLIIADSVEWLYIGRFLGGLPFSMVFCCFSLYIGEIADPNIRGTLISIAAIGSPLGTFISIIAETYLPMKLTSSLYLVQSVIGMALFIWLKDTPYFLMRKGNTRLSEDSIIFYHPTGNLNEQLKEIQDFVETKDKHCVFDKMQEFKNLAIRKSMFLIFILFSLPHLSGFIGIISYMEVILKSTKFNLIKPKECVIYINIFCVLTSILSINMIDKLGRRFLLIFSGIGTILSMITLGLHFYLSDVTKNMQWLPVTSILLYVTTFSLGFNSVPSTVLSEIFPENMKSTAVCVATISTSLFGFIIAKAYQPIVDNFGEEYAFWMYAVLCMIGLPIALHILPETKGKTFQEIQNQMVKG